MARITIKSLTEQLSAANARISSLEAQLADAAQPAAKRVLPAGYRTLVVNGVERFTSADYAYLSEVAKRTKAQRPQFSVQIR